MKRAQSLLFSLLFFILFSGCGKASPSLTLTYSSYNDGAYSGYCVTASAEDDAAVQNLLFSATSGCLFAEKEEPDNAVSGTVTVPNGTAVVWLPDDTSRQTTVQLTVTAFDAPGKQLASQKMTFTLSGSQWQVIEEKNVQPVQ